MANVEDDRSSSELLEKLDVDVSGKKELSIVVVKDVETDGVV